MSYLNYTKDFNDNLLLLFLRDHRRYTPIVEFFDYVTKELSELDWADAEMIAEKVSQANHSEFCSGIRSGMTKALNADESRLHKEKLAPLVAFSLKLNHDANSITASDVQTILDAGWSEQTVEDLVGLVAIQRFYNIIATGMGFKGLPAEVFTEIGIDTVQKGGYAESFRSFISNVSV